MNTDDFCRCTITCIPRLSYLDYLTNSTCRCTIIHYPGAILKGLTGRDMTGGWRGSSSRSGLPQRRGPSRLPEINHPDRLSTSDSAGTIVLIYTVLNVGRERGPPKYVRKQEVFASSLHRNRQYQRIAGRSCRFRTLICDKRTCTTRTYSFAAALTKVQMTQIIYSFWRRKPISLNY